MRKTSLLTLAAAVLGAAVSLAAAATASVRDNGILNQTQVYDGTSDAGGGGVDLSTLTVTTYTDATVSFAVQFANRDFLHPGETVQIFVDLNDDGTADLNLSIWPTFDPSYLAHWTGSDWADVRQLPELVQTKGGFSVRLSLNDLQGAAGMQAGSAIGVAAGSWTEDPATSKLRTAADDLLPDSGSLAQHQMTKPAATTTAHTTTTSPPGPAHARLAARCSGHSIVVTDIPVKGSKIVSVSFRASGKLRAVDKKAPFVATIPTKTKKRLTITAVVHLAGGGSQTLTIETSGC